MKTNLIEQQRYQNAQKRVKEIKGFYSHLIVYILVNIFISSVVIYGSIKNGDGFSEIINEFGVYSTWLFWGIGVFFHWLGIFGFKSLGLGKDWEERKIKEFMEKESEQTKKRL